MFKNIIVYFFEIIISDYKLYKALILKTMILNWKNKYIPKYFEKKYPPRTCWCRRPCARPPPAGCRGRPTRRTTRPTATRRRGAWTWTRSSCCSRGSEGARCPGVRGKPIKGRFNWTLKTFNRTLPSLKKKCISVSGYSTFMVHGLLWYIAIWIQPSPEKKFLFLGTILLWCMGLTE